MNKDELRRAKNREYARRFRERHPEHYRAYHDRWMAEHPGKREEYERNHAPRKRARHQAQAEEAKRWCLSLAESQVCVTCGEPDPVVLEFHHRDPATKGFNLCHVRAIPAPDTVAMVMAEIAKCEVLCANCHRRLHRAVYH